ncbi:MAG: hypothetical protein IH614_12710 [Desulfuromonadales bacterium]|nr:hypothetical protein [Desulfuromonadales bacterium]
MIKRFSYLLLAAAMVFGAGLATTSWAQLAAMGPSIEPHGFPSYYEDATGLRLEPCLPPPAGFSSVAGDGVNGMCAFDPLDLDSDIKVAGEIFWWMATASIDNFPGGGDAILTLGIEGTFGGAEDPVDGQQITFGRTRIRIDTPVAGTYIVTHPYGQQTFVVTEADVLEGINYTADIGAANFLDPALGFMGTLSAPIGPFLTWPDYLNETLLKVFDTDGTTVLEQYVGDPGTLSPVVGSPNGNNFFRVQGPGFTVEQEMFSVMGKVYDPSQTRIVRETWPEVPLPKLFAVGPVNRVEPLITPTTATVTGVDLPYPVGYPIWYQENIGYIQAPEGGVKLTLCTPGDPLCISDPIDPNDADQVLLRTGGEGFWWSAGARIEVGDDRYQLILGLEATFGGDESLIDGQQISFGRERIDVDFDDDMPVATYRFTHPYGVRILSIDPARTDRIRFTADIGIADPVVELNGVVFSGDPDGAFVGALYSDIGPKFLKWTTFNENPALTDPLLKRPNIANPNITNYYVGDPGVLRPVTGSPTGNNFFRVEKLVSGTPENGTWELVGQTSDFAVSGQVFDPAALGLLPEIVASSIGVFRNGTWYLDADGNGSWNAGTDFRYTFGLSTDQPVVGDWDGSGTKKIGVFRNGTWYLDANGNGLWDAGIDTVASFGQAGDIPIVGDWDGSGTDKIGVFRAGKWYLDADGNGAWNSAIDSVYTFGQANDIPVTDGGSLGNPATIAVFRNGTWYIDDNGNGAWDAGIDLVFQFGQAGDIPVVGDWNGNGDAKVGVFRNGTWYLDLDGNDAWNAGDLIYSFGQAGDKPVAGNW